MIDIIIFNVNNINYFKTKKVKGQSTRASAPTLYNFLNMHVNLVDVFVKPVEPAPSVSLYDAPSPETIPTQFAPSG